MNIRYLVSFFILSIVSPAFQVMARTSPLLVVLIMVKNEHEVIIPTLDTYITQDIKDGKEDTGEIAYILYDTGSTDGTEEMARKFFEDHSIKEHLVVQEFVDSADFDFDVYRNRGLKIAREAYPDSTFILFPDAEWYLHGLDDLVTFCQEKKALYESGATPPPYYRFEIAYTGGGSSFITSRLLLTQDDVEFVGDIHEVPDKYCNQFVPRSVTFEVGLSRFGTVKSHNRWYRDRNKLMKRLQKDPKDPRTLLYLGQTENCLGHNHIAYMYLKKRSEIEVLYPQEDFHAMLNLADVTAKLSHEDPKNYSWEEAFGYYMKAHTMRPHRAEPLVQIADHYLKQKEHAVSYLFARRASELPLPSPQEEMLTICNEDYSYNRWEILSRAAWYVQDYELGEKAAKMAIEAQPNEPHLYRNLACYWERKK